MNKDDIQRIVQSPDQLEAFRARLMTRMINQSPPFDQELINQVCRTMVLRHHDGWRRISELIKIADECTKAVFFYGKDQAPKSFFRNCLNLVWEDLPIDAAPALYTNFVELYVVNMDMHEIGNHWLVELVHERLQTDPVDPKLLAKQLFGSKYAVSELCEASPALIPWISELLAGAKEADPSLDTSKYPVLVACWSKKQLSEVVGRQGVSKTKVM